MLIHMYAMILLSGMDMQNAIGLITLMGKLGPTLSDGARLFAKLNDFSVQIRTKADNVECHGCGPCVPMGGNDVSYFGA